MTRSDGRSINAARQKTTPTSPELVSSHGEMYMKLCNEMEMCVCVSVENGGKSYSLKKNWH